MIDLIKKGFNENTLNELKKSCYEEFDNNPTVYFVLYNIFSTIEESFEGQAMPKDLYNKYESLIPVIEDALSKKDINSIDKLTKSFVQIRGSANFFIYSTLL